MVISGVMVLPLSFIRVRWYRYIAIGKLSSVFPCAASTALDIYAHAFDKNKRKAQEKLGKAIGL